MNLNSLPFSAISQKLNHFDTISLADMDSVSLMDRTDTKFILNVDLLPEILDKLLVNYRVLEINNNRFSNYKTDYLDTQENEFFLNHHNGKLNRYKVRFREYIGSNLSFLEVKFKDAKGKTHKSRIKSWVKEENKSEEDHQFIKEKTPHLMNRLFLQLTNKFSRITLVNKADKERVTIDFNLSFSTNSNFKLLEKLCIFEVKQEKVNRKSPVMQTLKSFGVGEGSFSKYALGSVLLNKKLKYNRFKKTLLFLNKIHNNGTIWS